LECCIKKNKEEVETLLKGGKDGRHSRARILCLSILNPA